jgi:predicted TIM-barrel fold metal-dependent hydrolase
MNSRSATKTETGTNDDEPTVRRVLIASSDAHAGMPESAYREYFERAHWEALDELVRGDAEAIDTMIEATRFSGEVLEVIDRDRAIRSGGERGAWDVDTRLREMDREGVAWELLYMGSGDGTTLVRSPFAWEVSQPYPPDLRAAGARAYNRWLADHMAGGVGRLAGAALVGPCHDLDAEIRELEWLADRGFVAVYAPGTPADPSLPRLSDSYFEPFWSACEDLGLRLALHVNWGVPQEDRFRAHAAAFIESKATGEVLSPQQMKERLIERGLIFDSEMPPRRAVVQLMVGGVFDRHPGLGAVITELRADWTPAFVAHLDARFERGELPTRRRPSEYWRENFRLAPSFVHRAEIEMREEIGMQQMLYGRDYPHPEGTWPNTLDWLRDALRDVSETEARQFLGENAVEWFGLDRQRLEAVAEVIGPRPDEILGDHRVEPRVLDEFHARGGYLKPRPTIDLEVLDRAIDDDLHESAAS